MVQMLCTAMQGVMQCAEGGVYTGDRINRSEFTIAKIIIRL